LVISAAVYSFFKSWPAAIVSFLSGVFVDIDHLLDYYLSHGITFNVMKFYEACNQTNFSRLLLVFHSYEFIAILWFLAYVMKYEPIWTALAIGSTQHLAFDEIVNSKYKPDSSKFKYFFLYRLKRRFSPRVFVKQ